ncbi:MAG: orotidine-5'-phosphate decarboxylase [Bacteroidales bacterium]|nr:orotidine-5'-phosphate decarboxylase [Bacteroidales bacterium]
MTTDQLYSEIKKKGSMLCVGLDTDYSRIPDCVKAGRSVPEAVLEFNRRIIDATAPHCVAFKPNLAFYECLGPEGLAVLDKTVAYIRDRHPGQFIIADAKRGDIGNTARMYAKSLFETFDFDAVTLSPYMGSETVLPFLGYPGRFAIVVALSSNPSSADFQTIDCDGKPIYRAVIEKMMEISTPENMMFVIGATKADKFKEIRSFCPDNFFLIPGVGAQGGSAGDVMAGGANAKGGLLINSSRGVIYASSGGDFAEAAGKAAGATARLI